MRISKVFIVALLSLFLTGCVQNKSDRIELLSWRYSDGFETDNNGGMATRRLKLTQLHDLSAVTRGNKGFITVTSNFTVPPELQYRELGLFLGKVEIAAKIYLNGTEIEQIGLMPPDAFYSGTNAHSISIPRDMVLSDQKNRLDIMVWVDGTGGISGVPYIGLHENVQRDEKIKSFYMSELTLIFAGIMFFVAIYYLILFFAQKKQKNFLFFGLMNITTVFYILPFFVGEFPWLLGFMGMNLFNKLFNGMAGVLTAFFSVSFFRSSLGIPYSKRVLYARLTVLAITLVYIAGIQTSVEFSQKSAVIYIFISMQLFFNVTPMVLYGKQKYKEILKLLLPFIPTLAAIPLDVFISTYHVTLIVPLFTVYGWALTDIIFLILLAHRYARMQAAMDKMNAELEFKVEERTKELEAANEQLEFKNRQAQQDLEMAVHMQKEFYSVSNTFFGWDVAVHFQPLAGVSGDLYDFYGMEGKLRGFGLFDVSGHGISSGLVTMLAKNAIFHEFRASLPLELSQAINKINDAIIRVKGDIENYMTGVLCRIDRDDPSKIELVNAGCPYPVIKKSKQNIAKFIEPDASKPQYGMLGVKDFDLCCQTIPFTMDEEDYIVLYTDGLNEATNKEGEEYGKERVLESIRKASGTAQDIIESILGDYMLFVNGGQLSDDLTVVVVKRASQYDDLAELEEL